MRIRLPPFLTITYILTSSFIVDARLVFIRDAANYVSVTVLDVTGEASKETITRMSRSSLPNIYYQANHSLEVAQDIDASIGTRTQATVNAGLNKLDHIAQEVHDA
jgi:Tfp pilus assembly protein PilV